MYKIPKHHSSRFFGAYGLWLKILSENFAGSGELLFLPSPEFSRALLNSGMFLNVKPLVSHSKTSHH